MIKNTTLTCGNCQLICWGDPEETRINYGILNKSGCVVKDVDGNLIVLPPEEAAKHHAMQKKPNIIKRFGRGILRRIAKWYLSRHYDYLTGDRA